MTRIIENYELTEVKAIAENAGDTEAQDALRVHLVSDEYADGDCILYGYSLDDFSSASEITDVLMSENPETSFDIDEDGIYHA